MKNKEVAILVDSCNDLPQHLSEQYNLYTMPLMMALGKTQMGLLKKASTFKNVMNSTKKSVNSLRFPENVRSLHWARLQFLHNQKNVRSLGF